VFELIGLESSFSFTLRATDDFLKICWAIYLSTNPLLGERSRLAVVLVVVRCTHQSHQDDEPRLQGLRSIARLKCEAPTRPEHALALVTDIARGIAAMTRELIKMHHVVIIVCTARQCMTYSRTMTWTISHIDKSSFVTVLCCMSPFLLVSAWLYTLMDRSYRPRIPYWCDLSGFPKGLWLGTS